MRQPRITKLPNNQQVYENNDQRLLMQAKIEAIFKVAVMHGHTHLVLDALCGTFEIR